VSPQNILLGFDGVARLTDFGIAKAFGRTTKTTTGLLKGKAGYMSPEQLRFENPDRRSDLFSLGVCLYELLSGDRLYREEDVQTAARRILNEPPPDIDDVRDDVPASLVELLFELLAKDPSHRPHLAREVARRLEDVLTELVPTEGAFELADYLEAHYGPHRRRLLEDIERLWAEVDESERSGAPLELVPSRITSPPDAAGRSGVHRPRRRRRLGFLAAMLAAFVIATVVGIVLGLSLNEPSPPTPMAAPAEETGTSPTDPAEFPSAEPLELDPIELEVAPAAPEAPAEETASELVPDPEAGPGSSDEAARARARRRRRAARMRADMLWDW
jgi:serine/threonine-protein kinase